MQRDSFFKTLDRGYHLQVVLVFLETSQQLHVRVEILTSPVAQVLQLIKLS